MLCSVLIGAVAVPSIAAEDNTYNLDKPAEQVVLTISGNISRFNSEKSESSQPVAALDLAMLEALGSEEISTKTPWTEGDTRFEGVRLSDLLELVGARSNQLTLAGLDSYSADINTIDFNRYPIIVAYKRDAEYMTVRSLGPLWLMFPFDQYPELLTEANKAAAVWQLISIVVH